MPIARKNRNTGDLTDLRTTLERGAPGCGAIAAAPSGRAPVSLGCGGCRALRAWRRGCEGAPCRCFRVARWGARGGSSGFRWVPGGYSGWGGEEVC